MLIHKSTVQAPVHLGVFCHDVTRLVYSPPPLSGKYIHYTYMNGGRVGEGEKEKESERGKAYY